MKEKSDFVFADVDVSPDRLRYLLNQITYHFSGDMKAMRKTHDILLSLIGEFANDQTTSYANERARKKPIRHKT